MKCWLDYKRCHAARIGRRRVLLTQKLSDLVAHGTFVGPHPSSTPSVLHLAHNGDQGPLHRAIGHAPMDGAGACVGSLLAWCARRPSKCINRMFFAPMQAVASTYTPASICPSFRNHPALAPNAGRKVANQEQGATFKHYCLTLADRDAGLPLGGASQVLSSCSSIFSSNVDQLWPARSCDYYTS